MLLPSQKASSYSLLKFVYVTSQLRHPLVVEPLLRKILDRPWAPPRGGTPHMKGVGMLVVSLRGVNFGFWSHLGCSGQQAIIFSRDGSRLGLQAKKYKYI